jgi:hypothetical protein
MSVIEIANRERTHLCTVVAPSVGLSAADCFFGPAFGGGVMFLDRSTLFLRIIRVHPPDRWAYLLVSFYIANRSLITYNSGMITSSAFLTCTTLCPGFAAILNISSDSRNSLDQLTWILCPASPHRKQIKLYGQSRRSWSSSLPHVGHCVSAPSEKE